MSLQEEIRPTVARVEATPESPPAVETRRPVASALRRLSACVLAGVLVGLLVGGVGGRLAMMLLAVLNDAATGRISDDGFRIGQLTRSGTLNLLFVGGLLGGAGGALYSVLRGLRVGPWWFQLASISVGPAVVVGSMLVHVDGVDFQILDPVWLAIALFVAIPGLYGALLMVTADRWLAPGRWPERARAPVAYLPLLVLAPMFPVAVLLAAGWAALKAARSFGAGRRAIDHPASAWLVRAALTVIFCWALLALVQDTAALT